MFKKVNYTNEMMKDMAKNIVANKLENKYSFDKIAKSIDYLNSASEILEDTGFEAEAEAIIRLIEKLADKRDPLANKFQNLVDLAVVGKGGAMKKEDAVFYTHLPEHKKSVLREVYEKEKLPGMLVLLHQMMGKSETQHNPSVELDMGYDRPTDLIEEDLSDKLEPDLESEIMYHPSKFDIRELADELEPMTRKAQMHTEPLPQTQPNDQVEKDAVSLLNAAIANTIPNTIFSFLFKKTDAGKEVINVIIKTKLPPDKMKSFSSAVSAIKRLNPDKFKDVDIVPMFQ